MQTVWLGEVGDEDREESPEEQELEEEVEEEPEEVSRIPETIDTQKINWRGRITEFCQKRELHLPDVNEIQTCGARGTFSFVCKFNWGHVDRAPILTIRTCGTAKKKKFAKREAARLMCSRLSDLTNFPQPSPNIHNPEDRGYWGPSYPACPRSADESGEVCPPLGYQEFDHSEPLPDIWGEDGYEENNYSKAEDPSDYQEPSSRFHPYQRDSDRAVDADPRGNYGGFGRMPSHVRPPVRGGNLGYDSLGPRKRGSMFL